MTHTFLNRFPTKASLFHLLVISSVPLHIWGIVSFIYRVPSYLIDLNMPEIFAIFAYNQGYLLIESLVFTISVFLLVIILPYDRITTTPVAIGTIIVVVFTLWLIALNDLSALVFALLPHWSHIFSRLASISSSNFSSFSSVTFLTSFLYIAWFISLLGVLFLSMKIIRTHPKLAARISTIPDRFSVIFVLFALIDLISLLVILIRQRSSSPCPPLCS